MSKMMMMMMMMMIAPLDHPVKKKMMMIIALLFPVTVAILIPLIATIALVVGMVVEHK